MQYSAVEWTRTKVAVRNVVAPTPDQTREDAPGLSFSDASFSNSYTTKDFVVNLEFTQNLSSFLL